MQISRNIANGPKSNNYVLVGIWIIVCVQKLSHHFLQTFRPLPTFKIVFRDSSLYPEQLSLFCLLWLISANFADTFVWKTWIWRQIMTSQTTHTKYKWHHTPLNEHHPMKIFCVRHWCIGYCMNVVAAATWRLKNCEYRFEFQVLSKIRIAVNRYLEDHPSWKVFRNWKKTDSVLKCS